MRYEILDESGEVINTILASIDFVEKHHPGSYREVVQPQPTQEDADAKQAAQVRAERNTLLAASDWTQLADSTADKAVWAEYRQALRDVTAQTGFPWSVEWPVAP